MKKFFSNQWVVNIGTGVVTFVVTIGITTFVPNVNETIQKLLNTTDSFRVKTATSTVNLIDTFEGIKARQSGIEKKAFYEPYVGGPVMSKAIFLYLNDPRDDIYTVDALVKNYTVTCHFVRNPDSDRKLMLLKKGDRFAFDGTFTNTSVYGGGWSIDDCHLLDNLQ